MNNIDPPAKRSGNRLRNFFYITDRKLTALGVLVALIAALAAVVQSTITWRIQDLIYRANIFSEQINTATKVQHTMNVLISAMDGMLEELNELILISEKWILYLLSKINYSNIEVQKIIEKVSFHKNEAERYYDETKLFNRNLYESLTRFLLVFPKHFIENFEKILKISKEFEEKSRNIELKTSQIADSISGRTNKEVMKKSSLIIEIKNQISEIRNLLADMEILFRDEFEKVIVYINTSRHMSPRISLHDGGH